MKSISLATLLFIESFLLSASVLKFIESQKYFSPPLSFMISIIILFFLITTTNALLVGAWDKWEQYVLSPLPVCLGIFLVLFTVNSAYAVILILFVYLLMSYDVFLAAQLKRQLLVFNPRLVLKFSSKGIILSFSIMAAVMVMVSAGTQPDFDIGGSVGGFIDKYFTVRVNEQINQQLQGGLSQDQIERLSAFGLDPSQFTLVEETDIFHKLPNIVTPELSLKNTVTKEVNKLIEPYKKFVNPIMAIMIFGLVHFLGAAAFFIHTLFVDAIFWAAKKTKFHKIEKVPAEQEILHF